MSTPTVNSECDVLVVGGGPVGLLSAYLLCHYYDAKVILIEKSPRRGGVGTYSREFGISPRTLELFDTMEGLGDQIRQAGMKITSFYHIFPNKTFMWENFLNATPDMRDATLLLPQSAQEFICEQRFRDAGGDYRAAVQFVGLKQSTDPQTILTECLNTKTNTSFTIKSQYVIGADGAHSSVRKDLNVTFDGYTDKMLLWLADISKPLAQDTVRMTHSSRGPCVQIPIDHNTSRLMCGWANQSDCPYGADTVPTPQLYSLELKLRGVGDFMESDFVLCDRLVPNFRKASQYRVGNVFLLGDAAHVHSPAGGQGLNMGYQDAINLCWKLGYVLKGNAESSILDSYHAERTPIAEDTLKMTAKGRKVLKARSPARLGLMSFLLGAMRPCWWPLRLKILRAVYQATLRPQNAFQSWDTWRGRGQCDTQIGCRFPNLLVQSEGGDKG